MAALGTFVLTILLYVFIALYYAWAASNLWLWFVVSAFHLPALSVLQMWGLMLFVSLARSKMDYHEDDRDIDWSKVVAVFLVPLIAQGVGLVILRYI